MSGCPLSLFYSTRLNGPFRDWREIDGKTNPQNKTPALFFSAPFSGSQLHAALSTPNILHAVKSPIKICFSLPCVVGQNLQSWKLKSGWTATSETSHSSFLTLIFQCLSFSSSDRLFSCQAKHVILFKCCPGAADSPECFSACRQQWKQRKTTICFIYYLWKVSYFWGRCKASFMRCLNQEGIKAKLKALWWREVKTI